MTPRAFGAGALLLAIIAAVAWLYGVGTRHAQTKAELQAAETALDAAATYVETRKDLDDATADLPVEPDAVRERLRSLAE